MRFIPEHPSASTKSDAEKMLFELFRHMRDFDDWVCLHSLRLDEHAYQKVGEIDFLFVGPPGLFALEVKGGRISFDGKAWIYTNRFGKVNHDSRGPMRQVEDALYSLMEDVRKLSSIKRFIDAFTTGWAVAFPDVTFNVESVEYDAKVILDENHCRSISTLGESLGNIASFWRTKKPSKRDLTNSEVDAIVRVLRPRFDLAPTLSTLGRKLDRVFTDLTERQYLAIDSARRNRRILCSGGAGTGKSFVALEAARRARDDGKKVLFTSGGNILLEFLKHQPDIDGITFAALPEAVGIFDFVIIDEGQDVMSPEIFGRLDQLTGGSWQQASWLICLDPNSQSHIVGTFDPSVLSQLEDFSTSIDLSVNCRNTSPILSQTKFATGADTGVTGAGDGPPVTWCPVTDELNESAELAHHLHLLVNRERLSWRDISIVDLGGGLGSLAALPSDLKAHLQPLTKEVAMKWDSREITFGPVGMFKGLENLAICVIGGRNLTRLNAPLNHLYAAMSRARTSLWVATTSELGTLIGSGSRGTSGGIGQATDS